jgi:hypothetical protein
MQTLPLEGSNIILQFRSLFSKKVFQHAITLLIGSLLAIGKRTVCAVLRFMGLQDEKRFHKYHRVLSLVKWSLLKAAKTLLLLLVNRFCDPDQPIVLGIDETIERRRGDHIKAKGIYRDPVRSSKSHFVKCSGLRWVCLMLLTKIPWAARVWALPFLCALAPSERYHQQQGKKHKTITDWARQMILLVHRWLKRRIVIVADSTYAAIELLGAVRSHVTFITRLRTDAGLYGPPPQKRTGKAGRPALKGKRLPTLEEVLKSKGTQWKTVVIPQWYNEQNVRMQIATGTALWYHSGMTPVPIRWVLLKDPEGKKEPAALLCTDLELSAGEVIDFFIQRWTVEVTFEETRAHLGIETQRQWSDRAIAHTTPCLLGLFSITTLWADSLQKTQPMEVEQTAWYKKKLPTFSDALAAVRKQLWEKRDFCMSTEKDKMIQIPQSWLSSVLNLLIRAA